MKRLIGAVTFTLIIFANCFAQTARPTSPVDIAFTVAMSRPHTHLFEVDIHIKRSTNAPTEESLIMPVWTPGSYLVREFERNVQDFTAKDAAGQTLKWEKVNKDIWRVQTNGAIDWHASY